MYCFGNFICMEIFHVFKKVPKNWKCFELYWNKIAVRKLNWLTLKFLPSGLNWLPTTQFGHMVEGEVWGQGSWWKRPKFQSLYCLVCFPLFPGLNLYSNLASPIESVLLTCPWNRWESVDNHCKSVTMAGKTSPGSLTMYGEQNIYPDELRRSQLGNLPQKGIIVGRFPQFFFFKISTIFLYLVACFANNEG